MKISSINYLTKSQIYFNSRVKKVCSGKLPYELNDEIDNFEETHKNASELGSGLFATAYLLNGTNYVIKESFNDKYSKAQNRDFFPEAEALGSIPDNFKNSQKLVAHVQTEKNNYYLITTFMNGKAGKYPLNPWTPASYNQLFKTLFTLDTLGIYHNDVNQSNCLVDKNDEVNIIDYQFADKFQLPPSSKNEIYFKTPDFMMPANAQMFEMANLPWYIHSMSKNNAGKEEIRKTFKDYIEAKANYAHRRAMYLGSKNPYYYKESIDYELLQAKYFKNPTDDIINLQAKKLQLMYSFRKTFSLVDPNSKPDKNIISALPSYIATAKCAKDMILQAEKIKNNAKDPNLKKFMDYEIEYGKFWRNTMLKELGNNSSSSGTWSWIERNAQLSPKHLTQTFYYGEFGEYDEDLPEVDPQDDIGFKLKASEKYNFIPILNIGNLIANKKYEIYTTKPESRICILENKREIKKISEELIAQIKQKSNLSNSYDTELNNLTIKYIDFCEKGLIACKNELYNSAIPDLMMAQYYAAQIDKLKGESCSNKVSSRLARECGDLLINYIKSPYYEKELEHVNDFDKISLNS